MEKNNVIKDALSMAPNRRRMLKKLVTASAALGASGALLEAQSSPSPSDVVQFALNLEYLEAEFYSIATTGQTIEARGVPINGSGQGGPTTTAYGKLSFVYNEIFTAGTANNISMDEMAHVVMLRTALENNGIYPIAKPAINLDALASMGMSLENEKTFLVLGRAFEDIGVSAYNGGVTYLSGSPYLMTASRIVATEGEHVGNLRLEIARLNIPTTALDGADIIPPPSLGGAFMSTNPANGFTAYRTPGQVLYLAYGMANVTSGGFFPNGVNGVLNQSSGPATALNLS